MRRRKAGASARERVLDAAYDLFRHEGTRNVGVDAIVQRSGVAKMSLYRHFNSKSELISAFLERREKVWMIDWLRASVLERAATPADQLLAIFDAFDEWFHSDDFDGCSFMKTLLEYPEGHPIRREALGYLVNIRAFIRDLATDAGIEDAEEFASVWDAILSGTIVAACEGRREAARQVKEAARLHLEARLPDGAGP